MIIQVDLMELSVLSRGLNACGAEVDELRRALSALIGTTAWSGGAADGFRQEWEARHRPALDALAQELALASLEVERRRAAFEHAAG